MKENFEVILYLSNGYPTIESSIRTAKEYADAGCTMIEIDFPSHHPYLEGEMIAGRMKKALEACDDYDRYMEEIIKVHQSLPKVKLLVLVYENTVLEIGEDKFIEFCLENELRDVILVGLSDQRMKENFIRKGLRVSCYVQFQMLKEEVSSAVASNGFVYMQAKPASGQGYVNEKYATLKDCITHLRGQGIDRPIYCGVGVHDPSDVAMVKQAGGDGAFVGSAILKLQENLPAMKDKIREFIASGNTR